MFGNILPYAKDAASNLASYYAAAEQAQQGVFQSATQSMNQLAQSRAQEAQALAQETGGPVSVGEFTASMGYEPNALAALGSGQMLNTLGNMGGEVGQAEAFSGQVLPLVSTEQQAQAKGYYEDQIKGLNDQISAIKATRGSAYNKAYNDLITSERQYQLDKQNQHLNNIKAQHDWQATKLTLAQEKARLAIELQQLGMSKTNQKIAIRRLTDQEQQYATTYGLKKATLLENVAKANAATRLATQRLNLSQKKTWADYLDAAISPKGGTTVASTIRVPLPPSAAWSGKSGVYGNQKDGYYTLKTVHNTVNVPQPIHNPTQLVQYLRGKGVPQKVAVNMVRHRLNIGTWKYGEPDPRALDASQHRGEG
jgi:hypothetical protein